MKETLTTSQVADRLRADQYAGWSYEGSKAMAEYLEQIEENTGEEMEMNVYAVRRNFTEYDSALAAAVENGFKPEEEEEGREAEALKWLQDKTTVIEFEGGVIIQVFYFIS